MYCMQKCLFLFLLTGRHCLCLCTQRRVYVGGAFAWNNLGQSNDDDDRMRQCQFTFGHVIVFRIHFHSSGSAMKPKLFPHLLFVVIVRVGGYCSRFITINGLSVKRTSTANRSAYNPHYQHNVEIDICNQPTHTRIHTRARAYIHRHT